jgi:hypothetical protein
VVSNWDNTPRCGARGFVFQNSTPELFAKHLESAYRYARTNRSIAPLVFIRSWNEWAEGNHLEPDLRWGRKYLEAVRHVVSESGDGRRTGGGAEGDGPGDEFSRMRGVRT